VRFETDDNNSYFLAHLDIHPEFLKELEAGTTPQATPKALELLRVLKQGPKTRSEMMESMNLKDVMNFFKNYISPALEAKYIAMQYPDSPKHPNQKYYLTDLGKSLLEHQS
jgi:ATP-dependent DNA helicase RecG